MTGSVNKPFFADVEPVRRVRNGSIDVHTLAEADDEGRKPAVVFVHGGPVRADQEPSPRDWEGFIGYGALAAASGLVGITFNHRLYDTDTDYPRAAEDVAAVVERTRALAAVPSAPKLPKLLLRVGGELPFFAQTQDAFVDAARTYGDNLEVIELPEAQHGFESHGYVEESRAAVEGAMDWVANTLHS